ncbi:uncharacterized protein CBL_07707 [Carabus blaptoides fortunei]
MDTRILTVVKSVLFFWIYLYGLWSISVEILFSTLSVSAIGIAVLTLLIYFTRIPTPNAAAVDAVIGKDPAQDQDIADDGFVMRVVAHRGAGLDAPENSLVAFRLCAEKGCSGVEFDVTLTADNVPVIFHDDTLERLTGSTQQVRRMTWKSLSKMDISVKHPLKEKFENTRIAKLDDTILQCLNNKQRMFIDIKEYDSRIVKVILDLYEKYPALESKAVCSSFYPNVIYMIRRKNPKIVCSVAWRPHYFAYQSYSGSTGVGLPRTTSWMKHYLLKMCDVLYEWLLPQLIYYMIGIPIILLHKDVINGKVVNDWRNRGVRVIAWTVNHPVEKQHCSRILKITYMTDTLIGETSAHTNNSGTRQ